MEFLTIMFPLVFANNPMLSLAKFLAGDGVGKTMLRVLLVIFAFIGVISTSALTGDPVDFNRLSELAMLLLEVAGLSVASHFSYRVITGA